MADKFRAKLGSVAGIPVAVVDITITRTLIMPIEWVQKIGGAHFKAAGLDELNSVISEGDNVPEDARPYFYHPWTEAYEKTINLLPFSQIVEMLNPKDYLRLEGDATQGFKGKLNFMGVEFTIDMSKNKLPLLNERLENERRIAREAYQAGRLTEQQWNNINHICNMFGQTSEACGAMYRAHTEMLREQDAVRRQQQMQQQMRRENLERDRIHDLGRESGAGNRFGGNLGRELITD
ncbi:MAG TPA: hypothetical protein VK892_22785 [Pyrinomonadaceae bacterium]|nr:hypothetical protein [Pyrinomonadaceae bacterium]